MIKSASEYGICNTPLLNAKSYGKNGNIYVKLEKYNLHGSIKVRTAYFIIKDIVDSNQGLTNFVEASSGNLGIGLGYFAKEAGLNFLCLIDPTVSDWKIHQLERNGIKYKVVEKGNNPNYRLARINYVKQLELSGEWKWTNQYDNPANFNAHYSITGPEIYEQMKGKIDYLVCSVGTGGTICGIASYLKEKNPNIVIVGVEPMGSTIFGGEPGEYITAGSGLSYLSGIMKEHISVIDLYSKVKDDYAIRECKLFKENEGEGVGITTGAALYIARKIADENKDKNVVCISPDGDEAYMQYIYNYDLTNVCDEYEIKKVKELLG